MILIRGFYSKATMVTLQLLNYWLEASGCIHVHGVKN